MQSDRPSESLVDKAVDSVDGEAIGIARGVVVDGAGRATHVDVELPGDERRSIPLTGVRVRDDRVVVTYTADEILQMPATL
jgi:PRC-barrel domain